MFSEVDQSKTFPITSSGSRCSFGFLIMANAVMPCTVGAGRYHWLRPLYAVTPGKLGRTVPWNRHSL